MYPKSKRIFKQRQILLYLLNLLNGGRKTCTEMTSSNFNQFMKTKINLNSKVLSKNTSEIVSTCIEKLYQHVPAKFKNGLQQIKIAAARKENRAPLRMFKEAQQSRRQQEAMVTPRMRKASPSNIDEALLLRSVMNASRKRLLGKPAESKKLLKPPTYKIYNARRYGSSASSSNGSLFRRKDTIDKQRAKPILSAHALRQLQKSFSMIHGPPKKPGFVRPATRASIVVPERNQHMRNPLGSVPQAMAVSSNIQHDLMAIDEHLKNRIRGDGDARLAKILAHSKVWDYPPAPQLSKCRNEQIVANSELQQQCRRLQMVTQLRTGGTRKEVFSVDQPLLVRFKPKRQRFTNPPFIIQRETLRPTTMSINERRVSAKRKPLAELQRPQVPDMWSQYASQQTLTSGNPTMAEMMATPGPAKLQKPYKINGRIAPTITASLASASLAAERYNRINHYAKLSTNVR